MRQGKAPQRTNRQSEKLDREFHDFIVDLGVTSEELAVLVQMPTVSILEVKGRLRRRPGVRANERSTKLMGGISGEAD